MFPVKIPNGLLAPKNVGSCHWCFQGPIYHLDNDPKEKSWIEFSTQRQGWEQSMLHDYLSASIASHAVTGVVVYFILHACKAPESLSLACNVILLSEVFSPLKQGNKSHPFSLISSFSSKTSPSDKNTLWNVVHVGSMDCTCSVIPFLSQSW